MAVICPRCGAAYDITLFQFGRCVECECGGWLDLRSGHTLPHATRAEGGFPMAEIPVGKVSHYFSHLHVAAVELTGGSLSVGDVIRIKGHTTDFVQPVTSIQIEHQSVATAGPGQSVGIEVREHAREHDVVYKVVAD